MGWFKLGLEPRCNSIGANINYHYYKSQLQITFIFYEGEFLGLFSRFEYLQSGRTGAGPVHMPFELQLSIDRIETLGVNPKKKDKDWVGVDLTGDPAHTRERVGNEADPNQRRKQISV